jgi:prepilin-type N-terminal cleavage/methylation domain-containing protein
VTGRARRRGVTLLELLIVLAIVSLLAGLSFPSVSAGLDAIRLRSAADSTAAFLAQGLTRVERTQRTFELRIYLKEGRLELRSALPGHASELKLPDGVRFLRVLPPLPVDEQPDVRSIALYPGGTFPRVRVDLVNARGGRRRVTLDPVTAAPEVTLPDPREAEATGEEQP